MTLSSFAAYIKQLWRNKPDTSTPVTAERLAHMEEGIKGNSDAIEEIAAAVVSQIINDPDKIASMAAVYAVNQKVATLDGKVGDTAQLPDGATDVVTAIAKQNSDLDSLKSKDYLSGTVFEMVKSVNKTPFSFVKVGNANIEDSPCENKTTEFICFVYGNNARKIVIVTDYSNNKMYVRSFYNDHWSTNVWRSISFA